MDERTLSHLGGVLADAGDRESILSIRPIHGSSVHRAYRFETKKHNYFIKFAEKQFKENLQCEYNGLQKLKASRCVQTPEIYAYHADDGNFPAYLLMEWIEKGYDESGDGQKKLGEALAALHDASAEIFQIRQFGFEENNFIGSNPQKNEWMETWPEFFVSQRLKPQIQLGVRKGYINQKFHDQLLALCEKVPAILVNEHIPPSLIHGDLWGGNVIIDSKNQPFLIDPAVYFGVPEAELAFTELFGGFSQDFYDAYDAVLPIPYGYKERKNLYNLYHVLNHLNLFGNMYLGNAQSICQQYLKH